MLTRVAPSLFQASTGDTVKITAVAQNNNGPEAAAFRYGPANLPNVPVQQHPGCQFVVAHGVNTFGGQLLFDPASPNASYDLFEVDAAGNLIPLQVSAKATFGPIIQFQIDGLPVASLAAATRGARAFSKAALRAPAAVSLAAPARAATPRKRATRAARKTSGAKKTSRRSAGSGARGGR